MRKKLLCLVIIIAFIVIVPANILSISTSIVDADISDDYSYSFLDDGNAIQIDAYHGDGGDITIPSIIEGKPVISIGYGAFEDYYTLNSVVIPDSMIEIGSNAFSECEMLTSVVMGNGVTTIEYEAFEACRSLRSITIGDNVKNIVDEAFGGCSSLTTIVIPSGVVSIGNGAFSGTAINSIKIPDSVVDLGERVFQYCNNLTTAILGSGIKTINNSLFDGCPLLSWVNTNGQVDRIGDYAFCNCYSLSSFSISDEVTYIGNQAFSSCSSLTTIYIPATVTSIGGDAFMDCDNLTSIDVDQNNKVYAGLEGVLYTKDLNTLYCCPSGKKGDLVVPDKTISVYADAFSSSRLTSVTIGKGVTTIGEYAFSNSELTDITIGSSVSSIGGMAFFGCKSLKAINFLGLHTPSVTYLYWGIGWTDETSPDLRGHAYPSSLFPSPGSDYYGLTMGAYILDLVAPDAPTDLAATSGNGFVSLTWLEPATNGGSPITNYYVYRGIDGGQLSQLSTTTERSYTDVSATYGVSYVYAVTAVNSIGESDLSNNGIASPINTISPPSIPRNFIAVPANGNVSLQWTEPLNDGGSTIKSYNVYRGTNATNLALLASSDLNYLDTTTVKGTTYYYEVRAVNSLGEGANSALIRIYISLFSTPSIPLGLNANAIEDGIDLTWGAPTSDGGSPILEYQVYRGVSPGNMRCIATVGGLSYEDKNIEKGQTYYYYIIAINEAGSSLSTAAVNAVLSTGSSNSDASKSDPIMDNWFIALILAPLIVTVLGTYINKKMSGRKSILKIININKKVNKDRVNQDNENKAADNDDGRSTEIISNDK